MSNTQYIAQDGERWDTISQKAYGTPFEVQRLIEANPSVPIRTRLEGGTVLEIPILENVDITIDSELLPPWKR